MFAAKEYLQHLILNSYYLNNSLFITKPNYICGRIQKFTFVSNEGFLVEAAKALSSRIKTVSKVIRIELAVKYINKKRVNTVM